MNILDKWLPEQIFQVFGWTLIHAVWQWILLATLLWVALRIFSHKSPQFQYKISLLFLGTGALMSIVTLGYEWRAVFSLTSADFAGKQALSLPVFQAEKTWATICLAWIEARIPFFVNCWFFGFVLFLFRFLTNLNAVKNLRSAARPLEDARLEGLFQQVKQQLGIKIPVQLKESPDGLMPMVFGVFKPAILIPSGLILQLPPSQLEAILAHELAHVSRHDYLLNLVQSALEVLFFYHPCFWWINQTVRELREHATDDLAIAAGIAPKTLATALAEVLNYSLQQTPELAMAASSRKNPTLQRIKRMLGYPVKNYPQISLISIPMIFTLIITAGILTQAGTEKSQDFLTNSAGIFPKISSMEFIPNESNSNPAIGLMPAIEKGSEEKFVRPGDRSEAIGQRSQEATSRRDTLDPSVQEAQRMLFLHSNGDTVFFFNDIDTFPILEIGQLDSLLPKLELFDFFEDFDKESITNMEVFTTEAGEPWSFSWDGGETYIYSLSDTSAMSSEEQKEWKEKHAKRMQELAEEMEEWASEMKARWKEHEGERQKHSQVWKEELLPMLENWKEEFQTWQQANEPKMKEFKAKMKSWEAEHQPEIEDFQKKLQEWMRDNQDKVEELQRSMEEKMQELQKKQDNN